MKIIDEIIKEPIGGLHRNKEKAIFSTKEVLLKYLEEYKKYTGEEIFQQRKEKFLSIGKQVSFKIFSNEALRIGKDNFFSSVKKILFRFKKELIMAIILIFAVLLYLF